MCYDLCFPSDKNFVTCQIISNNFCKSTYPPLICSDWSLANTCPEIANLFGILYLISFWTNTFPQFYIFSRFRKREATLISNHHPSYSSNLYFACDLRNSPWLSFPKSLAISFPSFRWYGFHGLWFTFHKRPSHIHLYVHSYAGDLIVFTNFKSTPSFASRFASQL